jgi:lipoate-protein ligase B
MSAAVDMIRAGEIPGCLFFLAHPETVALGLKDRHIEHPKDLLVTPERLKEEGIELVRSVRGGGITYHWPGQVVCYPVIALTGAERNIPGYMHKLEEIAIKALAGFGITAERRRDTPAHVGLWAGGRKIVSMGVRVSAWITSFGFAVNLGGDFTRSSYVRPCGIEGARLTTMEELLGKAPPRSAVIESVQENCASMFTKIIEEMPEHIQAALLSRAGLRDGPNTGRGGAHG